MINMRGTDERPREPKDALEECLRSLIGLEVKLPENIDELANLYRSYLQDRRVFLYLDNVADAAQISSLIPPRGCGMLVTSRSPIALAGIISIRLHELNPSEARELLLRITGDVQSSLADEICKLCGNLPLAIRAAGSLLMVTADLDASDFAAQLKDERTRLERLGTEGVDNSVRASFNLSYAQLSPEAADVFRRVAAFPFSFDSAAEEFVCEDKDHKHLSDLVRRSLVLYDKETKRYRMHELIRVYAKSLSNEEETSTSILRFAHHYLNLLKDANQLYLQSGQYHTQGVELFNHEIENIRYGWAWSNKQREEVEKAAQICWSYTSWGSNILLNRLPATELKAWCQASLSVAKRLYNLEAELGPLTLLGLAHESLGEYNSAEEYFRQALSVTVDLGDTYNSAIVQENLGRTLADRGHWHEAIEIYEHARKLLCSIGEHQKEGKIVSDIALAYSKLKDLNRAVHHLNLVLNAAREDGNKLDEANTLGNLSEVYKNFGANSEAIKCAEQAAHIFQELGYPHLATQSLLQSGELSVETNDLGHGIEKIRQALASYREIGDRHGELVALGSLAGAYMSSQDFLQAIGMLEEQLKIAREIGDRHREGNALGNKGIVLVKLGNLALAIETLKEAIQVAHATGNHYHKFNILCHLGKAYVALGRQDEAVNIFEEHIRVAKTMGVFRHEAHAIRHLVDLYADQGNNGRAIEYMKTCVRESQTSKDPHDYPDSVFQLAQLYADNGEYDEAVSLGETAIQYFEQQGDIACANKTQECIAIWKSEI